MLTSEGQTCSLGTAFTTKLRRANLSEAHLSEADLSGADLREADLNYAHLILICVP